VADHRALTKTSLAPPTKIKFEIKNKTGSTVASIDERGNLYLKGDITLPGTSLTPDPNSFILKDANDFVRMYVNSTGHMFLTGNVIQGFDTSSPGGLSKLMIKNSTDDIVAFVNKNGNLRLNGVVGENYPNP